MAVRVGISYGDYGDFGDHGACDYDILWALSSYTDVRAIACIRCPSLDVYGLDQVSSPCECINPASWFEASHRHIH